ncbi:MAG: 50S ribosomal protein L15 [Candidatus Aenigmarchaeota archaeon]|nr:50S ribosomal protein L15 [Candidatus Aenigmarchaeota archaeon]
MVVRKRKKYSRFRGNRHYHGSHKKARGPGNRGGIGQAGLENHKKGYMQKYDPDHFGKHGFKRHFSLVEDIRTINLKELDQMVESLKEKKLVAEEDGKIKVNLGKIGYDKLLGDGKVTKPLIVEGRYFSRVAVKKLEEIGGKAVKI